MNKTTSSLMALLLLGSAGAVTAAESDCTADLQQIEPRVANISSEQTKDHAKRSITLAFEAAEQGNDKVCRQLLSDAKKTAGIRNAG